MLQDAQPTVPDEAYAAALAGLPGMRPAHLTALLAAMTPDRAWSLLRSPQPRHTALLKVTGGFARDLADCWHETARTLDVSDVWRRVIDNGMGVTIRGRPGYPSVLADDPEPPPVLFHRGSRTVSSLDGRRVAIVGTRRCSSSGSGVAFELGRDLAASGVSVVSGLGTGIESAAHRGVLQAHQTPAIGVVATGLDVPYPSRNRDLWEQVSEHGLLLSEAPPGTQPTRWRFPSRRRIVAALADLVVVVEAHATSDALSIVEEAQRRCVPVMAVPGSVRSSASSGTNALLVAGNPPARHADDILKHLDAMPRPEAPSVPAP